ncbi:MAG: hypothetical protein ACEQSB_00155 [Undibacterium sp.]
MSASDLIYSARRELQKVQERASLRVSPAMSMRIGDSWRRALEQDPEGSQLKYVIEETRELLS